MKILLPFLIFLIISMTHEVLAQKAGSNKNIILTDNFQPTQEAVIIDGRAQSLFKSSHLPGAINIQEAKFGEYLGKTVLPEVKFFLVAADLPSLEYLIVQADSIGYTENILGAFIYTETDGAKMDLFDKEDFISNPDKYTIIDIRSKKEFEENKVFPNALNFPLDKLQDDAINIPNDKPIVVHCATGYRSTIGSSIILNVVKNQPVLDMGADIKEFRKLE